jgi:serine/threonine protein kinase
MNRQRIIEKLKVLEVNDERYTVLRELGRGGNGVALLCKNSANEEVVAKVYIPPDSRDLDNRALERFENEVKLTERLNHPNVVPSLGSGVAAIGTYRLPFYVMPRAAGTLRGEMRLDTDPALIEKKLRLFTRAAYGVACLHSHGVVHRDLKPENILLSSRGTPWVADLGIAHVNPEFVTVGLQTIDSERLLNRDYYAPEQRFGKATEVDSRADIYALGCIFYEMLTSIPPVRTNAPKLALVSSAYAPFEPIWERMTAWEPVARYQSIEDAMEDLAIAAGWVLASLRGEAGLQHPDLPTMLKLLRSTNETQRQRGVEIATRLGKSALPELHSLLGHNRRDIRNSVAAALAEIGDSSSVSFLIGGLYGGGNRPSNFRPSVDIAAQALAKFAPQERLRALKALKYPIRPSQIKTILNGLPRSDAYEAALDLRKREAILVDWVESDLEIFVTIDEERAWPEVKGLVGRRQDFKIQQIFPHLSPTRQLDLLYDLSDQGVDYSWHYSWILDAMLNLGEDVVEKGLLLQALQQRILEHNGKFIERDRLLQKLSDELDRLHSEDETSARTAKA